MFVDDGSSDRSVAQLREQFQKRPDVTRVVVLARNAGQHLAILAAFQQTRGTYVITLDADLQNPPEEIARLVQAMDAGADYVGTIRLSRHDVLWRKAASRLMNRIREGTTSIRITDQGCMLRGYHRTVIDAVNHCTEVSTYVPALAYTFARHPVEIEVAHADRAVGQSKYSLYRLIRLNFDLMTGFSVAPLQFFSMAGSLIALVSLILVVVAAAAPPDHRPGSRRPVHPVCDRLLPDRRHADGAGCGGRVRRAHLRAGAAASALHRGRRARAGQRPAGAAARTGGRSVAYRGAATYRAGAGDPRVRPARAVVFAYHDVGVRCLKTLLSAGVEVPLVVTVADDPGERQWYASVATTAQDYGLEVIAPGRRQYP